MKGYLSNAARMSGCKVILSYHNYERCPSKKHLLNIVKRCFDDNADIAKVVCKVNSLQDNLNIMALYDTDKPIIALGMGKLGRITRIAASFLGAPFTYAYPKGRRRTAEGQFTVDKMEEIINQISK